MMALGDICSIIINASWAQYADPIIISLTTTKLVFVAGFPNELAKLPIIPSSIFLLLLQNDWMLGTHIHTQPGLPLDQSNFHLLFLCFLLTYNADKTYHPSKSPLSSTCCAISCSHLWQKRHYQVFSSHEWIMIIFQRHFRCCISSKSHHTRMFPPWRVDKCCCPGLAFFVNFDMIWIHGGIMIICPFLTTCHITSAAASPKITNDPKRFPARGYTTVEPVDMLSLSTWTISDDMNKFWLFVEGTLAAASPRSRGTPERFQAGDCTTAGAVDALFSTTWMFLKSWLNHDYMSHYDKHVMVIRPMHLLETPIHMNTSS